MKKLSLIILVVSLVSCDHFRAATSGGKSYDSVAVKQNINNAFDSMHMAFKSKNAATMMSYLADDGKYLGTDPGEIWTKQQLGDYLKRAFSSDSVKMDYTVKDRIIMADDDGNSAVVVEQFFISAMSPNIEVRGVARADFKDNRWIIDFYSWNFIPKNEDIKKLNDAVAK